MTAGMPDSDASLYPRTYRISLGWRIFLQLFGLAVIGLGVFLCWKYFYDPGKAAAVFASLGPLALLLGFYIFIDTGLSKIVLYADAIEMHDVRAPRRLERAEIKGRKLIQTGQAGGDAILFIPVDPARKKIRLPLIVKTDAILMQWIYALPDLDGEERAQAEKELIESTGGEAVTPEDRAKFVKSAKRTAKILNAVTWIAAVACVIFPGCLPLVAFLGALPWIALALAGRWPALYTLNESRTDPCAGIALTFMLPGFFLVLNTLLNYHLLDWKPVAFATAAIALLLTFFAAKADKRLIERKTIFVVLPLMIPYGYGTLVTANALLDTSTPKVFETRVISKHYTSGKGAHAELNLAPWGSDSGGDIAVPGEVYDKVHAGGTACVHLKAGAFGVPWYDVDKCP